MDLPHYSSYTAFKEFPEKDQKTHSVYKYLRNWNLCNNNDFQNIAVNGGDSINTQKYINALKRDQ